MTHHPHTPDACYQLLAQLNDYVDQALAEDLCHALEAHLTGCADCQVVLDSLSKTIALYHGLRDLSVELPPAIEARLMQRLLRDLHPYQP